MRLAAVRVGAFTLRFTRPLATARGRFETRAAVLVELHDADGHVGYGEAAPWPGFGCETVEAALAALRRTELPLTGADCAPGEWPAAVSSELRSTPAARGALDAALWDLAARRVAMPLAEHLAAHVEGAAGPALTAVAVGALLTADEPDALREQAAAARAAGHRAAKLKLGAVPLARDVERARAAREGLGAGVALRGDANGAWDAASAAAALDALAPLGFDYVEQPLAAHDIEGLARLRRRPGGVRIAADESVATGAGFDQLLELGAADVVILKPALVGGPGRALGLAARARAAGCGVMFTHAFESAVGTRHALCCAAALGDAAAVHGLATAGLFERDFAPPPELQRGSLVVPGGAGLGLAVRGLKP